MPFLMLMIGCFLFEMERPGADPIEEVRRVAQNQPPRAPFTIKRQEWPSEKTAAPDRSVWGLTLGQTTADQAEEWLKSRGLDCNKVVSPRRLTTQFRCGSEIPNDTFPERKLRGKVSSVLLSFVDGEPIHYVELHRHYSDPNLAIADVNHTIEQVSARLGEAQQPFKVAPTLEHFKSEITHFEMAWRFQDVRATLTLYKMAGPNVSVREVWRVPGVETNAEARPGSKGHGMGGTDKPQSPHGVVQ